MKLTNFLTCLALAAASLTLAISAHAAGIPGQGTWETTLLGRDINCNPVAVTSTNAIYLYDTTLNLTWLRNADFLGVPFADWTEADDWAANLVTGSGGAAVSDWRLPGMLVGNPAGPSGTISYDGSSPQGYNVPGSSSEMAHLFYVTLGNLSSRNTNGTPSAGGFGLSNTGSFLNLRSYPYWMGTSRGIVLGGADVYWEFDTRDGLQWYSHENAVIQAMAVRTGDVAIHFSATLQSNVGGGLQLAWNNLGPGWNYTVLSSPTLATNEAAWTPLPGIVWPGTNTSIVIPPTNAPTMFYKVKADSIVQP